MGASRLPLVVRATTMVLVAAVAVRAAYIALGAALGTPYPLYVIASRSMFPTLQEGDIVVIQGVDPATIKVGDIIAFRMPGASEEVVVIHRVVAVGREGSEVRFRTKGDYNFYPDYWVVSPDLVYGKVVLRVPYVGLAGLVLREYAPLVVAAVVLAAIVYGSRGA